MYKKLTDNLTAYFFLSASILALILVLILENIFKFLPCALCIYERWPYFLILLLSITMLLREATKKIMFILIIAIAIISVLLTGYHIGVEHHIFRASESCGINYRRVNNLSDLNRQLLSQPLAQCDMPQKLFNIPITYFNLAYSAAIIILGFIMRYYEKYYKYYYEQQKNITSDN